MIGGHQEQFGIAISEVKENGSGIVWWMNVYLVCFNKVVNTCNTGVRGTAYVLKLIAHILSDDKSLLTEIFWRETFFFYRITTL